MELPSSRELELEVLLRQRETQLAELKDEVISLRRYLAKQPGPSKADLVTLPPQVLAILMPLIESQVNHSATAVSATVAGGLNQRMRQLQEENDELYNLLKSTETGKLKDEVRSLRRAVAKLEGALKESHQVISSLSEELDKTHEVLMNTSQHKDFVPPYPMAYSDPPRSYRPDGPPATNLKPPPTGPRAYKRPRLSDSHPSPITRPMAPLPPKPQIRNHTHNPHSHQNHPPPPPPITQSKPVSNIQDKDNSRHHKSTTNASDSRMELDDVNPPRARATSPSGNRERETAREREKNNKERERRDRESRESTMGPPPVNAVRRNGNSYSGSSARGAVGGGNGGGGGGPASGRKNSINTSAGTSHNQAADNRTLQERMGL